MSNSSTRRFPALRDGEFAVLQAEGLTGYVLTTTGQRAIGDVEAYIVFPSLDSARQFAEQCVREHPLIECWIYDHTRAKVELVRDEKGLVEYARTKVHTPWWRRFLFWRAGGEGH